MKNDMYMTDVEYLDLLKRARERLNYIRTITGYDNTTPGCKSTDTNVGLCDNSLTTKDTALFPKNWPRRKAMKHLLDHQKCPLDWRKPFELDGNGCFYSCMFFQKGLRDMDVIKKLYDDLIKEIEK